MDRTVSPLPLVWGAMLSSQAMFLAVPWILERPPSPPGGPSLGYILAGMSVLTASLSLATGRVLPAPNGQARWFVRWALAEATTLMGLVVAMTEPTWVMAIPYALGPLVLLVQYPREEP